MHVSISVCLSLGPSVSLSLFPTFYHLLSMELFSLRSLAHLPFQNTSTYLFLSNALQSKSHMPTTIPLSLQTSRSKSAPVCRCQGRSAQSRRSCSSAQGVAGVVRPSLIVQQAHLVYLSYRHLSQVACIDVAPSAGDIATARLSPCTHGCRLGLP